MQFLRVFVLGIVLVAVAAPSTYAALGSSKTPEEKAAQKAEKEKRESEKLYGKAYQEIAKGQKDLEKGNQKKALKRFRKAMDWSAKAVELQPEYYEAWNLAGFTARKLGDYDRSLTAYETCLELQPNYTPAREYLGEALVELGRIAEAREQLEALRKFGATKEADALAAVIEKAEHGETETAAREPSGKAD